MKNLLFVVIGMFILIVILTGVLLLNKKTVSRFQPRQSNTTSETQNSASAVPTAPQNQPTENCKQFPLASGCGVTGASINICSKQYQNYPSPADILTSKENPNVGIYTGTITAINLHLHTLTVTSNTSRNAFVFNGGSINGKMFDIHNVLFTDFYTLKTGVKVVVSFNCEQKNGFFTLNRFQMVQ